MTVIPSKAREGIWGLFSAAASEWSRHNAPRLGAALAFYTVLSLAPLLLIVFAICSAAFGEEAVKGQIFWQIRDVAGDQASALVQSLLKDSYHQGKGFVAGLVGIPVLLFGASGVLVELRDTLNYIWDSEIPAGGFGRAVRYRLLTLGMVPCIGGLMMAGITTSLIIDAAGAYLSRYLALPVWLVHSGNLMLTFLTLSAIFALVYRIFPAKAVAWRAAMVGALVTAFLFCAGNLLVLSYISHSGTGSAYGAAGSLVVFLVWVYYSSQIFLFGAEFTRVYAVSRLNVEKQVQ